MFLDRHFGLSDQSADAALKLNYGSLSMSYISF
jgi:hypothetical protein